jgi:hypothetical protein
MSELMKPWGSGEDRTSPEYLDGLLEAHFAQTESSVFGVHAGIRPPESFADLQKIADITRNSDCEISEEVDAMVEIIAAMPDRDEIVRRLPYDPEDGFITFILPS